MNTDNITNNAINNISALQSMEVVVPTSMVKRVEEIVDRLNKKLAKAELALATFVVALFVEPRVGGAREYARITITLPPLAESGWEAITLFRVGITESYAYSLPGFSQVVVPEAYRGLTAETAAHCEHCGWNRARKSTVLLRNKETGEFRLVGKTCVSKFLGESAKLIQASIDALDRVKKAESEGLEIEAEMAYDSREVVGMAIQAFAEGAIYTSQKVSRDTGRKPTWCLVQERLDRGDVVESRFRALADKWAAEFSAHVDKVDPNRDRNYFRNLETALEYDGDGMGCVTVSSGAFQTLVSFPMYVKSQAKKSRSVNEHFGEVGKRYALNLRVERESAPFAGYDGVSVFYTLTDAQGRTFSLCTSPRFKVGESVSLAATVKSHSEYRGVKQTVLNRFRVK